MATLLQATLRQTALRQTPLWHTTVLTHMPVGSPPTTSVSSSSFSAQSVSFDSTSFFSGSCIVPPFAARANSLNSALATKVREGCQVPVHPARPEVGAPFAPSGRARCVAPARPVHGGMHARVTGPAVGDSNADRVVVVHRRPYLRH